MRFHRLAKGRIVASGPDPEALDGEGMVFSDTDYRALQFRRTLRAYNRPSSGAVPQGRER